MTTAGTNRVAGLAMYADCGDLVVAFPISEIVRVFLAEGTATTSVDPATGLASVVFEGDRIPAWDLGQLLGLRKVSAGRTWIVLRATLDGQARQFAVSCDRSLAVRPRLLDLTLPARMFTSRAGAIVGAFATQTIRDDPSQAPTGFALSAAHLLMAPELGAAATAASQGKLSW